LLLPLTAGSGRKSASARWRSGSLRITRANFVFRNPGTISHRFECVASKSLKGFPPPPKAANLAMQRVGPDRDEMLTQRGLLTLRIPSLPFRPEGTFKWVLDPIATQRDLTNATWYTDGSMLGGAWSQLRATGFGLVVVYQSGELIGYGFGAPPTRIATAAAAELWGDPHCDGAFPFPPQHQNRLLVHHNLGARWCHSSHRSRRSPCTSVELHCGLGRCRRGIPR